MPGDIIFGFDGPLWPGPFKNAILVSTPHKLLRISEALVL
jgi:hypothetical protein